MNELADACLIDAARADYRERASMHARHCVCFAMVTSEPLAAELIDRAIELRAATRFGSKAADQAWPISSVALPR